MRDKIRVGITIGDINGIGLEVVLKSLLAEELSNYMIPVLYGSTKVVSYHKNILNDANFQFHNVHTMDRLHNEKLNVVNCWQENVNISLGQPTEESGKCAYMALDRAVQDLNNGLIDTLVTAPINKHAMDLAKFPYPGHTEFLADKLGGKAMMVMASDNIRVGLVTGHVPLKDVANKITKERITESINVFSNTLQRDFGKDKPVIAVLGLNPHAGDQGVIGNEDDQLVRPAVIEAKKSGNCIVNGPFAADGFFGSGEYKKYDGILAMYHDQGLIPFKLLSFGSGVNFTAGLNGIRTSPDHGTGYDIAGKNQADHRSFLKALFMAMDLYKERAQYDEDREHSMKKTPKPSEE